MGKIFGNFIWANILVVFLCLGKTQAQTYTILSDDRTPQDISTLVEVGFSSESINDPQKVIFRKNKSADIQTDYSSQKLWLKFVIKNSTDKFLTKWLYFSSPLVGKISLYKNKDVAPLQITGPGLPLAERVPATRRGTFEIHLNPGEEAQYYIEQRSHHALNTQLFIASPEAAQKSENLAQAIFFFYLGGILALVLYNLSLGLFTTEKDYLIYSFFASSFALTAMTLHGVMDTYIFPQSPFLFSNYLMFFSALSLMSASLFVKRFLSIKKNFVVAYWGIHLIIAMSLTAMLASFFAPHNSNLFFFGYWIDLWILLGILFFLYCGIHSALKRRYELARFFMLSWGVVLVGTGFWLASLHGLIPSSPFTQYSLLFANLGEMLVLSLGLAYKIKTLDREKRAATIATQEKERYHRLLKVLSHDVANAMNTMLFHSDTLRDANVPTPLKDPISQITKSARRIETILRNVREEEIYQSHKSHPELHRVDLQKACSEAIRHFSWELNEKGIEVHVNIPAGVLVMAERSALVNQVLSNLLSNSIKFSEPGRSISFEIEKNAQETRLQIKDEGTGIPPEYLGEIFKGKKFFSERGTSNETGSGLGTALVGEYMKLFKGRIEVQSVHKAQSANTGTTVTLIFPSLSSEEGENP